MPKTAIFSDIIAIQHHASRCILWHYNRLQIHSDGTGPSNAVSEVCDRNQGVTTMRGMLYDSVDRLERMLRAIRGWIDPGRAHDDRVIRNKLGMSNSSIPDWP